MKGWVVRLGSEGDSLLMKEWVISWDNESRGQCVNEGTGH